MALTTVPASLSATALTLTTAAQPNITSVGTLTGLTVSGNIAGTLTTAAQPNITSVGTLTGLTVSGNIAGTLTTAAQTNITSVGTLTGLAITGDTSITKETPVFTLTDSSASRTLQLIVDDNNSVLRASGPLLLQSGGAVSAITLDASQNATFAGTITSKTINITGDNHDLIISSNDYQNVFIGNRGASGTDLDKGFFRLKSEGTNTVVIDTAGISFFNGGTLAVGTTSTVGSSAEKFVVSGTGSAHSRFAGNSDSYSTVYIKNSSTTANTNQPFLTFQDTGGNRGNLGLRYSTAQLVIQGHGGVGIKGGSGFSGDPSIFVNTSGNVGIGSSSPNVNLEIMGSNSYDAKMRFAYGTGSANSYANWGYKANSDGNKIFLSIANGGSAADILVAQADGNVSFGAGSSPTYKIEAAATSGGNGIKVTRGTNSFFEQFQSTTGGVGLAASGSGAYFAFRTGTTAGTTSERMRITEGASTDSVVIWNNASNSSTGRNFRVMAYDQDSYFSLGNDGNNSMELIMTNSAGATKFKVNAHSGITTIGSTLYMGGSIYHSGGDRINFTGSNYYVLNASNVGVRLINGNTSWTTQSDERTKENITDIGSVLSKIKNYRCIEYNLKSYDKKMYGFIAQDWETDFPHLVDEDDNFTIQSDGTAKAKDAEDNTSTDAVKTLSYNETIPVLLRAIQEQQAMIETLQAEVKALKGE